MSILLCASTTGYQTRAFDAAGERLGEALMLATDRCSRLDDPWRDRAVAIRFHEVERSVRAIAAAAARQPVRGVLAVGDRPAVLAAHAARALGIPWHAPAAADSAWNKLTMRTRLGAAGVPVPAIDVLAPGVDPAALALHPPVVVKPTLLSGSRGVIRADTQAEFGAAVARVRRLLESRDVRALRDQEAGTILVERYVDGDEYAVEALATAGRVRTLAVFDKPDRLDGPFFEETIYTTPTRAGDERRRAIMTAVDEAARALGLTHGPIHAECRVGADEVPYVIDIAARPIGGLCARALRFTDGASTIGLEELLLRHARGERVDSWEREAAAAAVMMIPIPAAGILRGVDGEDGARAVAGITDVAITAKRDRVLLPLPEGATYLGFLFARTSTPAAAEAAVRRAHECLRFRIDRALTFA